MGVLKLRAVKASQNVVTSGVVVRASEPVTIYCDLRLSPLLLPRTLSVDAKHFQTRKVVRPVRCYTFGMAPDEGAQRVRDAC